MAQPWTYPSDNSSIQPRRDAPPRKKLRPSDVLVRAAVVELFLRRGIGGMPDTADDVISRLYHDVRQPPGICNARRRRPHERGRRAGRASLLTPASSTFSAIWCARPPLRRWRRSPVFSRLKAPAPSKCPARSPWSPVGGWVVEGAPKMVGAIGLTTTPMVPHRLAAISIFTQEMLDYSVVNIERLMRSALEYDLGGILDRSLLDNVVSSSSRPAGLLYNVTPLPASALTPSSEALAKDIAALIAAVSTGHPDSKPIFIASTAQAGRLMAAGYPDVISTGHLAAGTIVALDSAALVMMVANPSFMVSSTGDLHMETSPLPLGTPPNVRRRADAQSVSDRRGRAACGPAVLVGAAQERRGCGCVGAVW